LFCTGGDYVQGEVTRDSEGGDSESEGEFGMGIDDEEEFRSNGRGGPKLEQNQRDTNMQVRASDPALRRGWFHRGRGRGHAGKDNRGQLRRFARGALPEQHTRPTLRRPQGNNNLVYGLGI